MDKFDEFWESKLNFLSTKFDAIEIDIIFNITYEAYNLTTDNDCINEKLDIIIEKLNRI